MYIYLHLEKWRKIKGDICPKQKDIENDLHDYWFVWIKKKVIVYTRKKQLKTASKLLTLKLVKIIYQKNKDENGRKYVFLSMKTSENYW